MSYDKIGPGKNIPEEVNVIIEIPAHASPVKYEVDKNTNTLFVDRFLATAMQYPCNYGFVPQTLSDDGDPVDVLVITPHALIHGSVITVRPIGVLKMTDESGADAKVLAVPTAKLSREYDHIQSPNDLPASKLEVISHFFAHYKDLEPNKWSKIEGWEDVASAHQEIISSVERYK